MIAADYVKLRFLRPYQAYRRGDVITLPAGPARSWIAAGVAELVTETQQELEVAAVERRDVETATAMPRRRRK